MGSFASVHLDNGLDLENLMDSISFEIISLTNNDMEVNIKGIDAPFANALRRVLIADIPTMAFDKAVIYQNTSIIHDEVLAHRLGLIPVVADPDEFIAKQASDDFNEHNSIKFKLHVKCTRKPEFEGYSMEQLLDMDPEEYLNHCSVYTKDLIWEPLTKQETELDMKPRMLYDNILLAKLRENQEIELEVYCSKNIGRVHAKWSPVATAYYRLKPVIEIKEKLTAEQVRNVCLISRQSC